MNERFIEKLREKKGDKATHTCP